MKFITRFLFRVTSPQTRRAIRDLLPRSVARLLKRRLIGPGEQQLMASRRADRYGLQLWRGFSREGSKDLRKIKHDLASRPQDIAGAAWHLASWHASHGRWEAVLENLLQFRLIFPSARQRGSGLLEADALAILGHGELARNVLVKAGVDRTQNPHMRLALANTHTLPDSTGPKESDRIRLEIINDIYLRAGVLPVRKRDPALGLSLSNLTGLPAQGAPPSVDGPKVSVLVPAYQAAATLEHALIGLQEQTWRNLEILVIDDQSSDETVVIAEDFARRDARVRVLVQPENRGSYAARNRALAVATGEFVTIHDADDWSHPQKIQLQAEHLIAHPGKVATLTDWVRCFDNLFFRGMARATERWVIQNISSLMMRRSDLLKVGGWDEVRVAADNELARRIVHKRDPNDLARVLPDVPLSFALESVASLTRYSDTHVHTVHHGLRRTYHDASKAWLERQPEPMPALPPAGGPRAFPAPLSMLAERQRPKFDILFVLDVNMIGGAFVSTWNYIEATLRLGLRVGVFHWRRYDLDPYEDINPFILQQALDGRIYRVSADERVEANLVLVGYPAILKFALDLPPRVTTSKVVIMTNQMATRLYSGGDVQYDPRQIAAAAQSTFGVEPTWIPISDLVRNLMVKDGRYAPIHPETWNPLIDSTSWTEKPFRWRGNERSRPRIGRHGRDQYTKWPTTAAAISAAYCANQDCDVVFLGGADHPIEILGSKPKNWKVLPFGSTEARTFLRELDFFIHIPHEDYIEEFGRAVLEAMAAGVPVVLAPVFEATFGAAALYAEPKDVWPLIREVWSSEEGWEARANAGRQFVASRDWSTFEARLENLHRSP